MGFHFWRWLPVALIGSCAGCGPSNTFQAPPPPPVTVARPLVRSITDYLEETGTTEAVAKVEIRARVRGFLDKVVFEPGAEVMQGDLLYLIQPREFEAQVAAAKADLEVQKVALARAEIEYTRQENLLKDNATAETNVIAAKAERDAAQAAIDVSAAALDQAQLNLEYTKVTSPIDGRVGKTLVKAGNLVGSDGDTHLTTVISYDPIYANFFISETDLLELMKSREARGRDDLDKKNVRILLSRGTDEDFPFEGHLDFADLTVDQGTGTYLLRGIFPNPDFQILPGLFVTVRVPLAVKDDATLVPEQAVAADQAGRYVLVVNSDNKVERRDVQPGIRRANLVVVDGVRPDDWVIVEGVQRARPGAEVSPNQTEIKVDDAVFATPKLTDAAPDAAPSAPGAAPLATDAAPPAPDDGPSPAEGESTTNPGEPKTGPNPEEKTKEVAPNSGAADAGEAARGPGWPQWIAGNAWSSWLRP